jgi:hypothetical protein
MSAIPRNRMPASMRNIIYVVVGGLWLSGGAWLLLQYFFRSSGEFGLQPHPLQPSLLLMHGVLAVAGTWLLGWISHGHALEGWRQQQRRFSGGGLWLLCALLVISGFALFFVTADAAQTLTTSTHEVLGVVVTIPALVHWWVRRRRFELASERQEPR